MNGKEGSPGASAARLFVVGKGHAKPLWAGHPWVHADAVREDPGGAADTDVALVRDERGHVIGRGLISERSAIRVRLVDRGSPARPLDEVLEKRVRQAFALRQRLFPDPQHTNTYRCVHAEGDGLPGLIVDRYDQVLVAQFATLPMFRRRERLATGLLAASGASSLVGRPGGYEREEGILPEDVAFEVGTPAPDQLLVIEEDMKLDVEPRRGQKTGHYTDQRENRRLGADVAAGGHVLDLFAGTAGFSIQALRRAAASSVAVESSPRAAKAARRNASLNGVGDRLVVEETDVREVLAGFKATGRQFDLVVLDPPNFFPRGGGEGRAQRAYRDLNVQALTRVGPSGFLATFSCSARLRTEDLCRLLRSAAHECRRRVRVLRELTAGPDHPVLIAAPEGRYLSGLLLAVEA
jgi:23S rRNA (cytosine1962-C5)-methyltransferase